jgi:hypothetical protein
MFRLEILEQTTSKGPVVLDVELVEVVEVVEVVLEVVVVLVVDVVEDVDVVDVVDEVVVGKPDSLSSARRAMALL